MHAELVGPRVRLRLLRESDAGALVAAASDGQLWALNYTSVPSSETVEAYIKTALDWHRAGTAFPYVIEIAASNEVVGSTRFFTFDRVNRSVEIGYTWLAASWQRSFVNTEAKYLLLRCAFEEMGLNRVQFQTDEINHRSRAAILRIGAILEGISRKDRVLSCGRIRNSVRFSVIDSEWPEVKSRLEAMLAAM